MKETQQANTFSLENSVREGLTAKRKHLPSWLFYDDRGSNLFREIMALPEYYLTNCEREILQTYSDAIAYNLRGQSRVWDVIELGAGDGAKTSILLQAMTSHNIDVTYYPVDISLEALRQLQGNVKIDGCTVVPVHNDFVSGLRSISPHSKNPRLILFMGANIGNFEAGEAAVFLRSINFTLRRDDILMVAFDLMKSPSVIEKAYNDYQGVTTEFNKNLLLRINNELDGNFNLGDFEHWCLYDPVSGSCRSYLVSLKNQLVNIRKLNVKVNFLEWEAIHTEVSQKYSVKMISDLAGASNLNVDRMLFDSRRYFTLAFFSHAASN